METNRLIIRDLNEKDLDGLFLILSDEEVMYFSLKGVRSYQQTKDYINEMIEMKKRYGSSLNAIIEKSQNQLIGICGIIWWNLDGQLQPELAYRFAKQFWGKGYAKEACKAILSHFFPKNLVSFIQKENVRSIKLAQSLGAQMQEIKMIHGKEVAIFHYKRSGLTFSNFKNSNFSGTK